METYHTKFIYVSLTKKKIKKIFGDIRYKTDT